MAGIEKFLAKRLKLKVNKAKSAVAKPSVRKFLGFSFTGGNEPRRRIAPQAIARFKAKVRELTRRTCGNSLAQIVKELSTYLVGWRGYFGFCQTPSVLRKLDGWLRRRLRAIAWKQWKCGSTRSTELRRCGVGPGSIWRRKPPEAHMALGGLQTASHSPSHCQPPSSPHSAWLPSQRNDMHNLPNRRIRTRMSWWCGRGGVVRLPPIPIWFVPERNKHRHHGFDV